LRLGIIVIRWIQPGVEELKNMKDVEGLIKDLKV